MKQLLVISFSVMVLLQHGVRLWVIAEFEANRDFISEMICVNKAVPETSCHGSCYLKARLKFIEQEEAPKENPHKRKTLQETVFHFSGKGQLFSVRCLVFPLSKKKATFLPSA